MARGNYERLTPQAIDEVWVRLRVGMAAKPTAREPRWVDSHLRDGPRNPTSAHVARFVARRSGWAARHLGASG
jgi:hypothetical protein